MTLEIAVVYGVLVGAIGLWASDLLRMDLVALVALLVLAVAGILTPAEALAGFADPVVIMIAGLFVVGEGLYQTGVAQAMGRLLARLAGTSEARLLAVVMLMVALLSAFMSSTGTVAVMLPVVVGLAWERGIPPSRLLIPVAVASLLGGMLTLIGTAPNIVVSSHLSAMGRAPFGFFTFTPVGVVMVLVGISFTVLFGRRLLPERRPPVQEGAPPTTSVAALAEAYGLPGTLFHARVPDASPLAGRTVEEAAIRRRFGVTVVGIRRARPRPPVPGLPATRPGTGPLDPVPPDTRIEAGDWLYVQALPKAAADFVGTQRLELLSDPDGDEVPEGMGLVEVLLTPGSRLLRKTLEDSGIREKYRVTVLSIRRMGEPILDGLGVIPLRFGDTLLVKGAWDRIRLLQRERGDFVVTGIPAELDRAVRPYRRAPLAVAILAAMMTLLTVDLVPAVLAVLMAAAGMVLAGCVDGDEAYRSINWQSVVLIAAVLPIATALEKTGGMALIVTALGATLQGGTPLMLLAFLFVLTSILSQVISNTATAVLLAPMAFRLALDMGAAPEPFLMTIAVAASTAFATPIASPVNTLVLGPGGYRFGDFFRIGVALQALVLAATLIVVPLLFPF